MGLAAPIYLLSLALIPLIVVYHVFRPKSTRVVVSSVVLWQKALTDAGRRSTWDRLVRNLLLLLQILIVIVSALLLSGFFIDRLILRPQRYMIVVDTSASMSATDISPDRLTAAKDAARSYLRSLPANSEIAVLEVNSSTASRLDYTRDAAAAERAISEMRVRNTSTNVESLISLLTAIAQDRPKNVTVALFTDGGFRLDQSGVDLSVLEGMPVSVFSIRGDAKNIAITGLQIRRPAYRDGPGEVFATLENFGSERQVFPLMLYHGDRVIRSDYAELGPFERKVITHQLEWTSSAPIRLEIGPDDHLPLDNRAETIAQLSSSRSVLLVTRDNKNLYLALAAIPGLDVTVRSPGALYAGAPYGYDLVVYDETSPGSTLVADTVVINSPLGISQVGVMDEYEPSRIVYIDESHPVMRFVDERSMVAESGQILDPLSDASVIAYGTAGPLVVVGREGRYRYAYFGFPFTSRTFVGSSSFPILISNLVSYMLGERDDVRHLSPGEPIYLPIASGQVDAATTASRLTMTLPSGDTREYEVDSDHFLYTETYDTGVYQVRYSGQLYGYAVNLFDRDELDIRLSEGLSVLNARHVGAGEAPEKGETAATPSLVGELEVLERVDYRPCLISLVLFMFVLEWALYHRRWHL